MKAARGCKSVGVVGQFESWTLRDRYGKLISVLGAPFGAGFYSDLQPLSNRAPSFFEGMATVVPRLLRKLRKGGYRKREYQTWTAENDPTVLKKLSWLLLHHAQQALSDSALSCAASDGKDVPKTKKKRSDRPTGVNPCPFTGALARSLPPNVILINNEDQFNGHN